MRVRGVPLRGVPFGGGKLMGGAHITLNTEWKIANGTGMFVGVFYDYYMVIGKVRWGSKCHFRSF